MEDERRKTKEGLVEWRAEGRFEMKMSGERGRAVVVGRVRNKVRVQDSNAQDGGVDEKPRSVYEVVTRQMLMELKEDLAEVKGRVNTLLWLVLGAAVVEFIMRLVR